MQTIIKIDNLHSRYLKGLSKTILTLLKLKIPYFICSLAIQGFFGELVISEKVSLIEWKSNGLN